MSEKRFTMKYSFEDEEYVFFDGDVALTPSETVKLLNEQQATIKKLEEENRELRQSVEYWQKKYEEGTETFQIN